MSNSGEGISKIVLIFFILVRISIADSNTVWQRNDKPSYTKKSIESPKRKRGFTPYPNFNLFVEQPLVISTCPYEFIKYDSDSTYKISISPEIGITGARLAIGVGDYGGWVNFRAHITGTWLNPKDVRFDSLATGLHSGIDFEFLFFIITMRGGFLYSFADAQRDSPVTISGGLGIPLGRYIMAKVKG